jgi:hypothetical protein
VNDNHDEPIVLDPEQPAVVEPGGALGARPEETQRLRTAGGPWKNHNETVLGEGWSNHNETVL